MLLILHTGYDWNPRRELKVPNCSFQLLSSGLFMPGPENPMAYLLEFGLRKVERERPEIENDEKYRRLKAQLLQDAEGHFREIQATYATVLKTQCHCGGQLEPLDHEFARSQGSIQDSVIAKCKACGSKQAFQFPKEGFISEARSAIALRDYLQGAYGIDYAGMVMGELRGRSAQTA